MSSLRPAYLVNGIRTPVGRHRGALSAVRADDLAAHLVRSMPKNLLARLDQVVFGATNQAGEDNRNIARMAVLLAGLPYEIPAVTVNRLCGSGLEAVSDAVRRVQTGDADVVIADLSTANPNALYELGIRHALRPRTTIVISENKLGYPFDLNHISIASYTHLGDAIDFDEVMRFRKILGDTLDAVLRTPNVDSPIYTFLQLVPPTLASQAAKAVQQAGEALEQAGKAMLAAARPNLSAVYRAGPQTRSMVVAARASSCSRLSPRRARTAMAFSIADTIPASAAGSAEAGRSPASLAMLRRRVRPASSSWIPAATVSRMASSAGACDRPEPIRKHPRGPPPR